MFPPAAGESGGGLERRRRDSNPQVLDARRISSAVPYQLGLRLLGSGEGVFSQVRAREVDEATSGLALDGHGVHRLRLGRNPFPNRRLRHQGVGLACGRLRRPRPSSAVAAGAVNRLWLPRSLFPHGRHGAQGVGLACGRLRRPRPSSAFALFKRKRLRLDDVRIPFPPIADAQRREWDSNPRGHRDQRLSRAPLLAAQPSLRVAPPGIEPGLF